MDKSENGKKYALIAAICYAVIALYSIINHIVNNYSITAAYILYWIITIGLTVTLLMKNKKMLVIAAGTNALLSIYYLFLYYNFSLQDLVDFLTYAALIVIVLLAIKGNGVTTKIWFVAAVILMVGRLIIWIQYGYFSDLSTAWRSILVTIVECAALLFVGMWLKDTLPPQTQRTITQMQLLYPQINGATQAKAEVIGGADKLKMYKALLDSGTITQEEFDQKKKQILGML